MEFLTPEQIDELLGSVRERGAYKTYMGEFLASGKQGANATARFPAKKPATVYQGLNLVKKDQNLENIRIINHDEVVYILRTDSVATDGDGDEGENENEEA